MIQDGCHKTLFAKTKKPTTMNDKDWKEMDLKAMSRIRLFLSNDVLFNIAHEKTT